MRHAPGPGRWIGGVAARDERGKLCVVTEPTYSITGNPDRAHQAYGDVVDALVVLANEITVDHVHAGDLAMEIRGLTSSGGQLNDPTPGNLLGVAVVADAVAAQLRGEAHRLSGADE